MEYGGKITALLHYLCLAVNAVGHLLCRDNKEFYMNNGKTDDNYTFSSTLHTNIYISPLKNQQICIYNIGSQQGPFSALRDTLG